MVDLGEDTPSPSDMGPVTLVDQATGNRYQYFCSAGGIQHLPEDFAFPQMSLVTLIICWFSSSESMRTEPYKMFRAMEIMSKKERFKLLQMKLLMLGMEIAAKLVGTWDQFARKGLWEVVSTVRLFESVHHFFDYPLKTKHRMAHISWQTVFNL